MAVLVACGSGDDGASPSPVDTSAQGLPPRDGDTIAATDYADPANWSVVTDEPDKPVDVFYLYPTTYHGDAPLSDVTDTGMRTRADGWLAADASAFETVGNTYMPYYRQLGAVWTLTQPQEDQTAYRRGAPYTDIVAAFEYYLDNYSEGRPFFIVAHSQGSAMATDLLTDYFAQHPKLAERLVAAYVIGYTITEDDVAMIPGVEFAANADDTGVVVSYNTVAPGAVPTDTGVILPGAIAINPISWTRSDKTAPASDNLGSYLATAADGPSTKVESYADATVTTVLDDREVVVCTTCDVEKYVADKNMEAVFGTGSLHRYDLRFYYFNLRENAENRAARFLAY